MSRDENDDTAQLKYFHGALLDEDVDQLLKEDGDYLLQSRYKKGQAQPTLCLVVRLKSGDLKRYDIRRDPKGGGIRISGLQKTFTGIQQLVSFGTSQKGIDKVKLSNPIPRSSYQLHHSDIRLSKKIGSGAYGIVFKGKLLKKDWVTVAVKRIESEGTDHQALIDMMKEARVMQLYDHPNIVKFYGYTVERTPFLIVMEFCNGGSVEDRLRDQADAITTGIRVDWCVQAATGIEYLHSKTCIHRDIATRNCLLHGSTLKLADFGMCRATAIYKVDLSKPTNVRWLAPEVWTTAEARPCTDIYAFGVMMWELFEIPYDSPYSNWNAATVKRKVMKGYRLKCQKWMPKEVADITALAWHQNPSKRPTAAELRIQLTAVRDWVARGVMPSSERQPSHDRRSEEISPENSGSSGARCSANYAVCRICYAGENSMAYWGTDFGEALIAPCSAGLVHRSCILYWLRTTSQRRCEICKHQFATIRVLPSFVDYLRMRGFGRYQDSYLSIDIVMCILITCICYTSGPLLLLRADVNSNDFIFKVVLAILILSMHMLWLITTCCGHYVTFKEWRQQNPREIFVDKALNETFVIPNRGCLARVFCCFTVREIEGVDGRMFDFAGRPAAMLLDDTQDISQRELLSRDESSEIEERAPVDANVQMQTFRPRRESTPQDSDDSEAREELVAQEISPINASDSNEANLSVASSDFEAPRDSKLVQVTLVDETPVLRKDSRFVAVGSCLYELSEGRVMLKSTPIPAAITRQPQPSVPPPPPPSSSSAAQATSD